MSDNFLIIMPTRGRRAAALEAMASVIRTADNPEQVRIITCQDNDDPERFTIDGPMLRTLMGPRQTMIGWLNEAWKHNASGNWDWVAWLGDDVRYRTRGWDTIVASHDQLLVYGMDGYQDEKLATHPFIRIGLPRWLGYLVPEAMKHFFPDNFYHDLTMAIGSIRYDNRILTQHLHPDAGLGKTDKCYDESRPYMTEDAVAYEKIKATIPELAEAWKKTLA